MKMKFTLPWEVCRICLQKGKLYPIFNKDADDMLIGDKLMVIADITVVPDKRLPEEICKKCAILLNSAYTFRMQCKQSDYILQLYLKQENQNKKPPIKGSTVMTLNNGKVYVLPKGVTLKSSSSTAKDRQATANVKKHSTGGIITTKGKIIKLPRGIRIKNPATFSSSAPTTKSATTNDCTITNNSNKSDDDDDCQYVDTIHQIDITQTGSENDEVISQESQDEQMVDDMINEEYIKEVAINDMFQEVIEEYEEEDPLKGNDATEGKMNTTRVENEAVRNIVHTGKPPLVPSLHKKIIYVQKDRKIFICELCGNTYKSKTGFDIHMRVHRNEKPFECEICGIALVSGSKLTTHMRRHTGEKPFKCGHCDRRFATKESKLLHERVHTGEKPYECDICNKKFTYACVLTRHKLIHTNENDKHFICPQCGKSFRFKYHLKAHLQTSTHKNLLEINPMSC